MCVQVADVQADVQVHVKNTFIHMTIPSSRSKRPTSAPPVVRSGDNALDDENKLGLRSEEESTEASEDTASDVWSFPGSDALAEASPLGSPRSSEMDDNSQLHLSSLPLDSFCLKGNWADMSVEADVPVAQKTPLHTPLKLTAKAWSPKPNVCMPAGSSTFARQIEQMLGMVQAMLMSTLLVQSVEVKEHSDGWMVAATVLPEHFHAKEGMLTHAKNEIMKASESSNGVYVVGYAAMPFVASPMGFAVLLAGVPDEHKACWGVLQKGFCKFADRCQWVHPAYQRRIDVNVVLPP